jgi:hypothetical protein
MGYSREPEGPSPPSRRLQVLRPGFTGPSPCQLRSDTTPRSTVRRRRHRVMAGVSRVAVIPSNGRLRENPRGRTLGRADHQVDLFDEVVVRLREESPPENSIYGFLARAGQAVPGRVVSGPVRLVQAADQLMARGVDAARCCHLGPRPKAFFSCGPVSRGSGLADVVAVVATGEDQLRLVRVGLDSVTEPADVLVQQVGVPVVIVPPHPLE